MSHMFSFTQFASSGSVGSFAISAFFIIVMSDVTCTYYTY